MDRYALTGPPGSGKSSIILELEMRGEYVTREAAEDYIRLMHAKGIKAPWESEDFQQNILWLSMQRENRISNVKRVFHDRTRIDGLAYNPVDWIVDNILAATKQVRYKGVFLIEAKGDVISASYRRENLEEAKKVENGVIKYYTDLGYELIRVAHDSVDKRVDFILNAINSF